MPEKYVCRLTKPVTIVIITTMWSLPILAIFKLIIYGGINIFALILCSSFIILLAPYALRGIFDRIIIMEDLIILKMIRKKTVTAKINDVKKISIEHKIEKYGLLGTNETKLSRVYFLNTDNKILIKIYLPGWKVDEKVANLKEQLKSRGCKGLVVVNIKTSDIDINTL